MKIIIAEKPSVASEYARVLGISGSMKNGFLEGNGWIVTWSVGHLIQMSYPEKYNPAFKEWKLETLPFLPGEFKYEVIPAVKHQFQVVKKLYNRSDVKEIYYAGDSGREGLYIQMLIRMMAGHNPLAKEKVVWIDSQTEEEILRGIAEAKPIKEYEHLSDAGYLRAKEDYLVGINFSRLLSLLYGPMVNTGSGQKGHIPIAVGRVMSCVLGMVTRREREIRSFRPTDFYRISGKITLQNTDIECEWKAVKGSQYEQSPKLYSESGFRKESDAREMIEGLSDSLLIRNMEKTVVKKQAPLLFNLAELQGECTRRFHISPAETLKIAQSLYEKKVTTYPRTDARVLSSAVASEIEKNLSGLANGEYGSIVSEIHEKSFSIQGKYVNDSKITDHYAIIPTGRNDNSLSGLEKSVFDLITRRFLAVFYPPAEYEKVSFDAVAGTEHFFGSAKYLSLEGYFAVSGSPKEDDNNKLLVEAIRHLQQNQPYPVIYDIKKGVTQPPKHFTSGSLILAMENAGNLIEDEELREQIKGNGIGTSATRADVIEKLCDRNYIAMDRKQMITPTKFGEMIYEVIDASVPDFLSPDITAQWERKLSEVENGKTIKQNFEADLYEYVRKTVDAVKAKGQEGMDAVRQRISSFATGKIRSEYRVFDHWDTKIKCPFCGDEIETTEWGFRCKSNKGKNAGCPFVMGDLLGHRLLTTELNDLLTKKKIGPFYDFVSSKGKLFAAFVLWNDKTKKITFEFTDMPWNETRYKCPGCGKKILNHDQFYRCEGYIDRDNGCQFRIGKVAGKTIGEKDVALLAEKGETSLIKGFKSKEGKKFDAFLAWNKEKQSVVFRFPTTDEMKTELKCPLCGGQVLALSSGFKCERNRPGEDGCRFFVSSFLGHTIKEKELEQILAGKETDLVTLKSGEGSAKKEFQARLYWNREEKRISLRFEENRTDPVDIMCPLCGSPMVRTRFGYQCSTKSKDEGCPFNFGSIAGVMLQESQVKKLFVEKKTDLIQGFKSKTKKTFSAYLTWNDETKKISFGFPDHGTEKTSSAYSCPCCSKQMWKGAFGYYCDCGFRVNKVIAGKEVEEKQLCKLLTSGETDEISGFFSTRKRALFRAKLRVDQNEKKVVFRIEDKGKEEKNT